MGGDEFIVVLHKVKSPTQVNETAGRINEALTAPIMIDGRPLVTTVSIGVSMCPRDGTTIGELLRQSDTAMYQAKDRGRNNFQLFSPPMDRKLKERMAIESKPARGARAEAVRRALPAGHRLETNRVVTLEALVRWKHPDARLRVARALHRHGRGDRPHHADRRVRARARDERRCALARAGCELVPIAVNVSAVQLQRAKLPATIQAHAKERGLKPSMLQIELTESAAFERIRAPASRARMRSRSCASSACASPSTISAPAIRACRTSSAGAWTS